MSASHFSAPIVIVSLFGLMGCGGSQGKAETPDSKDETSAARAPEPESDASEAQDEMPEVVARAKLVPRVSSIVPGKTFRMALYFEIVDGYRLSWTNPGDVGEMPEIRFSAPDGFEIGTLEWPAPERLQVTEDLYSYGYTDEAAVFVPITAPKNIETNEAYRFSVEGEWVACKNQCAKENVNAFIELVADWRGGGKVEHEALQRLFARVPKPFSDLKGAEHSWSSGRVLVLRAPSVRFVDFYPSTPEVAVEDVSVTGDGSAVSLSFAETPPGRIRGVVQVDRQGKPHFFSVEAPTAEDT